MLDDNIQGTIERVREIVQSSLVQDAVTRLTPDLNAEIRDALNRMSRKTAYVAAIGAQGCGKSSLLNSLLFSRGILPMGQGVTTNAVCYVQDAGESTERAEVTLATGKVGGPLAIDFLRHFMDEQENPDNQQGVAEIRCFARSDSLANHTIFVDTPGLGSTKAWHDRKTFAFAKDIALGICVVRSEELKGSEVAFFKSIWPLAPRYIFVQNVWGEPPAQVEARLADHRRRFEELAREWGDMRPVMIFPVNIHEGLEGATNSRPDLIDTSGLARLKQAIAAEIDRGGQRLEARGQSERIVALLRRGTILADRRIEALDSDGDAEALKAGHKRARARLKKLQGEASRAEEDFRQRHEHCLESFRNRLAREVNRVERDFRRLVDAGDPGEHLASDFQAALKDCIAEAVDGLRGALDDIEVAYVRGAMNRGEAAFNVVAPEAMQETEDLGLRVAEWTGGLATGVATIGLSSLTVAAISTVITTVTAGGTAGAGLALALATIPGVGWAAALGVLAVGATIRSRARADRKAKLIHELERVVKATCRQAIESVVETCHERRDDLTTAIEVHFRAVVAQQQKEISNTEEKLKLSRDEREREMSDLTQKKNALQAALEEITKCFKGDKTASGAS